MTPSDHMSEVAAIGCVICLEYLGVRTPAEIHHIAEGSGKRSDYAVAGLCPAHHRQGGASIHGMGSKAFLRLWKLPSEYWLLVLVNKYRG